MWISKDSKNGSVNIGIWQYNVIDGGVLTTSYPNKDKGVNEIEILSEKIKNLCLASADQQNYRNEWSLSPIKIDSNHFYLYGFFTMRWHIISIQLPLNFSNWLIEQKSELIVFESLIQTYNFDYLPPDQWSDTLVKPLFEKYNSTYRDYLEESSKQEENDK